MTLEHSSVEIPDRVELDYIEQGDPAGLPVILLHGRTDSLESFTPLLPRLPEDLHLFALSQRGHGNSARPATGYRTRDFAADVAAFIGEVGCGPAIIVGHSMGGANALRFAIDFPKLTQGLVLLGTFANSGRNAVIAELWKAVEKLTDPIDPVFALEFQTSTLAQPVAPASSPRSCRKA